MRSVAIAVLPSYQISIQIAISYFKLFIPHTKWNIVTMSLDAINYDTNDEILCISPTWPFLKY